jgi:Na+/proline symporter
VAGEFAGVEARYGEAVAVREARARELTRALDGGDRVAKDAAATAFRTASDEAAAVRGEAIALIKRADPNANPSDTNYVFLTFVVSHLPAGLLGLMLAAVFAASMNSVSSELNALASTTVVDVYRRLVRSDASERHYVWAARGATLGWGAFAIAFAENASRLGSLVEAVNILGSLFYGTILGVFLVAFFVKRVGGSAVFAAAIGAEAIVVACYAFAPISFLWLNLVGCVTVIVLALALQPLVRRATERR